MNCRRGIFTDALKSNHRGTGLWPAGKGAGDGERVGWRSARVGIASRLALAMTGFEFRTSFKAGHREAVAPHGRSDPDT